MTELIRPALYHAYHKIENLSGEARTSGAEVSRDDEIVKYDVAGPICESSDCLGKAVALPETLRGDIIALRTAGAYGEVMTSSYNLRPKFSRLFLLSFFFNACGYFRME